MKPTFKLQIAGSVSTIGSLTMFYPNLKWDITIDEGLDLSMQGRYLMTCNHQSWVDTTVNQYFGLTRMPLTRFFYQVGTHLYSIRWSSI